MSRGFVPGLLVGAGLAVGLGYAIAVVPSTPTWTLWEIKRALDAGDVAKLRSMVDVPKVATRALSELASGNSQALGSELDYKEIGLALLTGRKVFTVFNDPERPLRLGARDFLAAWWNMRRDDGEAQVSVDAAGREVSLVLGQAADGRWQVVGLTPLSALLRVQPAADPEADGASSTARPGNAQDGPPAAAAR